jgi:putative chitinase
MSTTLSSTLRKLAPNATVDLDTIANTLASSAVKYGVDTEKRMEAFIAQAAHETAGFKTLREYADGSAYEGRTALGNTQPGDGVRFRGRGIFQTTGRSNYKDVSKHLFKDERLLTKPELLEDPVYATLSALYFWQTRNLSALADKGDFIGITDKINGGRTGLSDRLSYYEKIKIYIGNTDVKNFIADARGVFVRNPEVSIVTALTIFSLAGYYVVRAAKNKK